ncbi:MAG: hypothetical protein KAT58_01850 [candidate division Zixibacteria bacterium]|nr:hypothetical protein [candidate division Zixibacteria bacterium]
MLLKTCLSSLLLITLLAIGCGDGGTDSDDTAAPTIQSFTVAAGAQYTTSASVTLAISATDDVGVTQMRFSENSSFTGASWVAYQSSYSYQFTGTDGQVTLYAQVRDAAGNTSTTSQATIMLAVNSTVIYCDPKPLALAAGSSGSITVSVANALALASGRFVLTFSPSLLEVTDLDVNLSNHILKPAGALLLISDQDFDNTTGTITIGALTQLDGFTGVTGDGPFATIEFKAKTTITTATPITFTSVEVYNYPVANPPVPTSNVYAINGSVQ